MNASWVGGCEEVGEEGAGTEVVLVFGGFGEFVDELDVLVVVGGDVVEDVVLVEEVVSLGEDVVDVVEVVVVGWVVVDVTVVGWVVVEVTVVGTVVVVVDDGLPVVVVEGGTSPPGHVQPRLVDVAYTSCRPSLVSCFQ